MDIEEMKKYSKNKIEADELTKQVRQRIKETIWDKQNKREGFTETFRPLISQFEKPEDPEKQENIFTQNQKMLKNQLALTEGIKGNQLALKGLKDKQDIFNHGFEQFERLANFEELPKLGAIEDDEEEKDDQARAPLPKEDKSPFLVDKPPIAKFDIEYLDKYLNNKEAQDILKNNGYDYLPSDYFDDDVSEIIKIIKSVNSDLNDIRKELKSIAEVTTDEEGYNKAIATAKKRGPTVDTKDKIENFNVLSIYSTNLSHLLMYKKQSGYGMFSNPEELLHSFELLNGSLAAGNNGVLPEYILIAHRLRDLGIITNNQLNKLLRKII